MSNWTDGIMLIRFKKSGFKNFETCLEKTTVCAATIAPLPRTPLVRVSWLRYGRRKSSLWAGAIKPNLQ
ncbi:hypothetical protein [Bradyrhizobium sp. dw_411]|uniref:hypothetical protein n=1 Tax=Bradyrhizobium sp. dw_411 TaxID=2720082 RepID=UPI001BCDEA96|nr:hypothetical protein [Bradyrhizobium sp. dw_411]